MDGTSCHVMSCHGILPHPNPPNKPSLRGERKTNVLSPPMPGTRIGRARNYSDYLIPTDVHTHACMNERFASSHPWRLALEFFPR